MRHDAIFRALVAASVISGLLCGALACGRASPPHAGTPVVTLHAASNPTEESFVEVRGLAPWELDELDARRVAGWTDERWQSLLKVTIDDQSTADSLPPVQGAYVVTGSGITFTPRFPFDPGRAYRVAFDPARLPTARAAAVVTTIVRLPPRTVVPTTVVTAVYPSAEALPENLLRMYIEFSAPMGNGSGRQFVRILDERGRDVAIPFLPIDADFWNPDHTRFTLFFDPGRVKQGILPNQEIGRPLRAGRKYTLVVATDWRDADGAPLKSEFLRPFKVGPAETNAIVLSSWRIQPPPAGTRMPIIVIFPKPLDHALLARAVTVQTADHRPVEGNVALEANDTRWLFTPATPWTAGAYDVVASSVLEDPAGNRIGRPFEAVGNAGADQAPDEFRVKFSVASARR